MGVGIELGIAVTGLLSTVAGAVGLLGGVLGSVVGILNPSGLLGLLLGLIP